MRESSNPVFRSLPKTQGGYAQFGSGAAAYGAQQTMSQQYTEYPPQQAGFSRPLTIDDVVTKTGITLAVLSVSAVISYFLVDNSPGFALAGPLAMIGSIGGLVLVLIATFGRKQDNPAIVLSYAVLEGLFLGAASFILSELASVGGPAMIFQAVIGTIGVFIGMLVVYKTGAIRVTPKFTRMLVAGMFGVVLMALANLVLGMFGVGGGAGMGLRDGHGSPMIAIGFSLLCIALAAFSFLVDFDAADQMIRAGAPEKAAWGIALGLTVTLVWLYIEILRLLSYFNND